MLWEQQTKFSYLKLLKFVFFEGGVASYQCDQMGLFLAHVAIFGLSELRKFWSVGNSPDTKLWLFLDFSDFY